MTRYRYDPATGDVKPAHLVPSKPRGQRSDSLPAPYFMSDIAEFVSPVGVSPERISSRSELREHEKRHGVNQVGTDYGPPGTIGAANEKKHADLQKKASQFETGWTDFS